MGKDMNALDEMKDSIDQHESYGILSISRTQGTPRSLYGSNIRHGDTIRLTISESETYRTFQKSRYVNKKELVEIEMSSAQFAEAITTLNIGMGVPVTLLKVMGERKENPPAIDMEERAKTELKKGMQNLAIRIDKLADDSKSILTQKGTLKVSDKKALLDDLAMIVQELRSNIPFTHECFQKAVEETVVQTKSEIDSCFTTMREKLGQQSLDGKIQIPLLDKIS